MPSLPRRGSNTCHSTYPIATLPLIRHAYRAVSAQAPAVQRGCHQRTGCRTLTAAGDARERANQTHRAILRGLTVFDPSGKRSTPGLWPPHHRRWSCPHRACCALTQPPRPGTPVGSLAAQLSLQDTKEIAEMSDVPAWTRPEQKPIPRSVEIRDRRLQEDTNLHSSTPHTSNEDQLDSEPAATDTTDH